MGHVHSQPCARAVLACDFFVVVTAASSAYVFIMLDFATPRVIHWNVTDRPTDEWTIQQFRKGLPLDLPYRFVLHDREAILAPVDQALRSMSLQIVRTPARTPQANGRCERFNGTACHECLDWVIALNERHLRRVLAEWIPHYNGERPHSALGPGLADNTAASWVLTGHRVPSECRVVRASGSVAYTTTTIWNARPDSPCG